MPVEHAHRVLLEPALELSNRDQSSSTAANNPQLVHDVVLEEVDADAQGVGRLALRKRETTERSSDSSLVLDRVTQGSHAPLSREPVIPPVSI